MKDELERFLSRCFPMLPNSVIRLVSKTLARELVKAGMHTLKIKGIEEEP